MRASLPNMMKPNSYTEAWVVNAADGWRERNVWYLGRSVRKALKRVIIIGRNTERTKVSRGYSVRLESRYFNCRNATTSFS